MGRIFETRKHKMFARFDRMAKAFSRIGKEISIAVKMAGPLPENNPRLRMAMQNAKGANMPKDRVENAIKKASAKDTASYEEVTYEGYAAHGVAVVVDTQTDNPTRTVANVRSYFNKLNGSLGTQGSVSYMFKKLALFKFALGKFNAEELELELIDAGLTDLQVSEDTVLA
ncbi:MAG: YebC/PmpR family DNA-binding transcriptional regulator, partial [Cyclobacteriaceae bacterium]|nr:YebC/PmpR family DNA-binding transcriptional regulator [Cyclobacteriaceae bacterium]